MSVPNDFAVIDAVYKSGSYDLDTHDGLAQFVDDAVAALHAHDPHWVHIKKKPAQKQVHGHAEDAALYLLPNNQAQGCDFVKGAGAVGATLRWGPDPEPYYKHEDGWDAHGDWSDEGPIPPTPPPPPAKPVYPTYEELGGDSGGVAITRQLEADYIRAGRPGLDGGCGAWQQRVSYDFLTGKIKTVDASIAAHRKEWCDALGIPVI